MPRQKRNPVPRSVRAAQVFGPLYQFLTDLDSGEVSEVAGSVVMNRYLSCATLKHKLFVAPDFIRAWCTSWSTIAGNANLEVSTTNLLSLASSLDEAEIVINESQLKGAKKELDAMRHLWLTLPDATLRDGLALL